MKRTLLCVTCLCWIFLASSRTFAADDAVEHVVLVSVDGLAASYLKDRRAALPNLRSLAASGAVAEGMITSFPSVTWPAHVSLITGVSPKSHGVVGNSVWNREKNSSIVYIGDPSLSKQEAIKVTTLYDVAHEAGLRTASVIWPCSNGAKTLDWVIPDSNKPDLHARFTTPGFARELAGAGIDISNLGDWGWGKQYSTQRDVIYTQVALHLLKRHKVNLLLIHLITPDGVEHAFGPHTPPAFKAVAESDQRIGEIWKVLQQPPFAGRSSLVVVSDHGFASYEKLIHPNVVLREMGLLETDSEGRVSRRDAWSVAQGGSSFVYLLGKQRTDSHMESVKKRFSELEGVSRVLRASEFTKLGAPDPASNPEAPDFILTTGPGYSFANKVTGPAIESLDSVKGTHGHDPRPEYMHACFIAAGKGIRRGVQLQTIDNRDVAPTVARLLGLRFKAEGRVLEEILENE